MRHLFVTLLLVFLCAGTAAATDFNQFNGTWVYTSAQMEEINKIKIEGQGKYNAQVWEKCSSGTCDYGWHNCNSYADGPSHLAMIAIAEIRESV